MNFDTLADLEAGALGFVLAWWWLWAMASQYQTGHISHAFDPSDAPPEIKWGRWCLNLTLLQSDWATPNPDKSASPLSGLGMATLKPG